jgi:transposase
LSRAISNDLRARIVDRVLHHGETYDVVAAYFQVGSATVNRVVNRYRRTGNVEPSPRGGGNPPWISDDELPKLRALVAEKPDRTALELAREWSRRFGAALSRSSMVRALARAGLSVKKSRSAPPNKTAQTSKLAGKVSGARRRSSRADV